MCGRKMPDLLNRAFIRRGFPQVPEYRKVIEEQALQLADMFNLPLEASTDLALQQKQHVVLLAGGLQGTIYIETVSLLESWRSIIEYSKVWGKLDLLARLRTNLFELQSIQRYLVVAAKSFGYQQVYYLRYWDDKVHVTNPKEAEMKAWVIIKAPSRQSRSLLEKLKAPDFPEITQIGVVYGEEDIILQVDVADNDKLSNLVFERLQRLDEVQSTRTYICVEKTYWQRR